MEFKLEYNKIVNKNRNIFYFQYYCNDVEEFKDWIKYYNISFPAFEKLNDEFKLICLDEKKKYIEDYFMKLGKIRIIDNIIVEKYYYFYYNEHKFIELINSDEMKEILIILKGMEQIYYRHQRKNQNNYLL